MLELLHIENIAVIEQADIQFRPGFNALTGETGAGKSIVIDAMGAVLGGRTSRELIRTGAEKAFVSAEFPMSRPICRDWRKMVWPRMRTGTYFSSGRSAATGKTSAGPTDGRSRWPSFAKSVRTF